jgi:hypothetical protein
MHAFLRISIGLGRLLALCSGSGSRGRPAGPVRLALEACERRELMAVDTAGVPFAAGRMAVGMNLENVVDWSPAWTFIDAFQASRPWIAHGVNATTGALTWDVGDTRPLAVADDGTVTALDTWTDASGQTIRQAAGTLLFRDTGSSYAAGRYRAEWEGTGTVSFGFDARVVARGTTAEGRHFADLDVTPSQAGIHLRIDQTNPADPVRAIHVWMPDWQGRSFVGQAWSPGADFSPFHPLFLERLAPFGTLRFMGMQETNSSDIRTWSDRRGADAIRQGSGSGGSPSEPIVNGLSVEYMVQLANDLDADAWFNMPHMADDAFVRNFATYVRDHLEPQRRVYVEWSNEIWNFGYGFEGSQWVAEQALLPAHAGLDHWQVAGREAKRDLDIWSDVFAAEPARLVRVVGGWAAVDWVTNRVAESMEGSFDAIAIAPYLTLDDRQRASYSAATTVDQVLADTRLAIATSREWVERHAALATEWAGRLGRPIGLLAYEGGPHLDGRDAAYQDAFHQATNDPRMGGIMRDYLRALDAAGLDLYVDFQFTGQNVATPWGDFAKLHQMDQPLATAHRYAAVAAAADGSLWGDPAPPLPEPPTPPETPAPEPPAVAGLAIAGGGVVEGHRGTRRLVFTLTLSAPISENVSVRWATAGGTARSGKDFVARSGRVVFRPGDTTRRIAVLVRGDRRVEADETFTVRLSNARGGSILTGEATGTIQDDDARPAAFASMLAGSGPSGDHSTDDPSPTRARRRRR